jgi:hypothetical protein
MLTVGAVIGFVVVWLVCDIIWNVFTLPPDR